MTVDEVTQFVADLPSPSHRRAAGGAPVVRLNVGGVRFEAAAKTLVDAVR
jgi:hypothetical protein